MCCRSSTGGVLPLMRKLPPGSCEAATQLSMSRTILESLLVHHGDQFRLRQQSPSPPFFDIWLRT